MAAGKRSVVPTLPAAHASTPPPYAFVTAALDRADTLRDAPEALRGYWPHARVLLIDDAGHTLADDQQRLIAPSGNDIGGDYEAAIFLGLRGDEAWFAMAEAQAQQVPAAAARVDLRTAAMVWEAFEATAFAQARALLYWRARHRHCGACGGALSFARGGWLGRCTLCASEHYPRTDPAVIVAVTDGHRLLLGRQASWPARRYSTLAGFVEPGETLEQTVAREVMEESAVRVRESRYLGSQPWPFPSSLMLGFIAMAEPDPPQPNEELEDAAWFEHAQIGAALRGETRESGLLLSPRLSISRWLIERWHAEFDND